MKVIIVTINESGNVTIDTNKLKDPDRTKYVIPIAKAIGDPYIKR